MGSFANRPKARQRAQRRRAQRQTSSTSRNPGTSNSSSTSQRRFTPTTAGGGFIQGGMDIYRQMAERNPKNKAVSGFVYGGLGNLADTMANTGLEIARNDAFMSKMGEFQYGLENLKTGNTLKLLGAEGAIAGELIGRQGIEQRAGIRETGEQERFNLRETGNQTLRLRGDARGAIRSQGARFYG